MTRDEVDRAYTEGVKAAEALLRMLNRGGSAERRRVALSGAASVLRYALQDADEARD